MKKQLAIFSFASALSSGGKFLHLSAVSLRLDCKTSLHLFQVEEGRKMYQIQFTAKKMKTTKCLCNPFLDKPKQVFKQLTKGQITASDAAAQTRMLHYLCMYIQIHLYTFIYTQTHIHKKEAPIFFLLLNYELLLSPGY